MNKKSLGRYLITCDPAKGGVHFQETNNLQEDLQREIEKKCFSIALDPDVKSKACVICPLGENDDMVISYSGRECSTEEPREHTVTRGKVMSAEKTVKSVSTKEVKSFFYEHFDKMERKKFFFAVMKYLSDKKPIIIECSVQESRILQSGLYMFLPPELVHRIYSISEGECCHYSADIILKRKIIYQRDENAYTKMNVSEFMYYGATFLQEMEDSYSWLTFYLDNYMEYYSNIIRASKITKKYFKKEDITLWKSEWIFQWYDLLFGLIYSETHSSYWESNQIQYKKLLDDFLKNRNNDEMMLWEDFRITVRDKTRRRKRNANRKADIDACVDQCINYIQGYAGSDQKVLQIQKNTTGFSKNEWVWMQQRLREYLYGIKPTKKQVYRYVFILMLAFQKYDWMEIKVGSILCPYDFESLKRYLHNKCSWPEYHKIMQLVKAEYNRVLNE